MTRTTLLTTALAAGCLLVGGTVARAQYPYGSNPYTRPTVSPYVNLLRGGASPALNYSTLVRPELNYRSSLNQLQGQTAANQEAITGLSQGGQPGGPLATGAQAGFQNHLIYFQTMSGGPGGGGFGFGTGTGGQFGSGRAFGGGMGSPPPPSRGATFGRGGIGGAGR